MPLPREQIYTSDDYWSLPDGERAELINGRLYYMAPPSRIHQELVFNLGLTIGNHIANRKGSCQVYPAPFAIELNADDKTYVEPDISVICDKSKLTDKACKGAPDFIIEVVSPSSRRMDYSTKNTLYSEAGVREYWIVDPAKERTTVYRYEEDAAPALYPFDAPVSVGIFEELTIRINDLIEL